MLDNSPCQTVKRVKKFPDDEGIEIFLYAQTPDLDLIENPWKFIGEIVMAKNLSTTTELWNKFMKG